MNMKLQKTFDLIDFIERVSPLRTCQPAKTKPAGLVFGLFPPNSRKMVETFLKGVRLSWYMKTLSYLKSFLLVVTGVTLLSGCVVRERVVYRQPPPSAGGEEVVVTDAPPAPIVETVTVAPGRDYVWIGGYWAWHGRWAWVSGRWAHPPRRGAVWRPYRYEYRNGVHVYIRGGWSY